MKIADLQQLIAAQTYAAHRPNADPRLTAAGFVRELAGDADKSSGSQTAPGDTPASTNPRATRTATSAPHLAARAAAGAEDRSAMRSSANDIREQSRALPQAKPDVTERPPRPGAFLDIRV